MILRAGEGAFSASRKRCSTAFFRISTARARSAPTVAFACSLVMVCRFRAMISERKLLLICSDRFLFWLEFILQNGRAFQWRSHRESLRHRARLAHCFLI